VQLAALPLHLSQQEYLRPINTAPATSATPSPASSETDLSRPKDLTPAREGSKTEYALNLVSMYALVCVITINKNQRETDQSVKILCGIWHPRDIPAVFTS
jgi:hypothetical protein